jgi:CheY-like chemotaxis protein
MAKKKILWVEDDQDIVASLQPRLEKQGWQVLTAFSGEEAKTLAVNESPDIIVMDIVMQGQHGYNAIEDLRSYPDLANIPIIVFSSVTHKWDKTTATREDALLSDAAEFIDKSSGPDALISAIKKYLKV